MNASASSSLRKASNCSTHGSEESTIGSSEAKASLLARLVRVRVRVRARG